MTALLVQTMLLLALAGSVAHPPKIFDIRAFGAKADGRAVGDAWAAGSNVVSDCVTTSGSPRLSCAGSHFAPGDVGKKLICTGCLAGGYSLQTTIAGYISGSQITMGANATMTMSPSPVSITSAAITVYGAGFGGTTVTCATSCGVTAGQWVAFQKANLAVYNTLAQVYRVLDSTHFTITNINGADPAYPLASATLLATSPRISWGHDDTAAIVSAVNAAGDAGGGSVSFPRGITFATYIPLGCSRLGSFAYGTCRHVYNNVELKGEGRGISTVEAVDLSPTGAAPYLIGVGGPQGGGSGLAVQPARDEAGNDWLRGFRAHDLTLREPLTFSGPGSGGLFAGAQKPMLVGNTWNAEIYNMEFIGASVECLYAMGNWGTKIHDNIAGPCGLSAYNLAGESEEAYHNTAKVSAQCAELGETNSKFHHNTCDMRGRPVQFGINIGSTVRGIWSNEISDNIILNEGIVLSNSNGIACNNRIVNNTIRDGIITVLPGLDYNKSPAPRFNPPSCPAAHGTTQLRGNTLTGDLVPALVRLSGPESYLLENTSLVQKHARCSGGRNANLLCTADTDCPEAHCRPGNVAVVAGLELNSGVTVWQPSTKYSGLASAQKATRGDSSYVIPSVPNGFMYVSSGADAISGTSEPAWCGTPGCTVLDRGLSWTNRGPVTRIRLRNNSLTLEHPPLSSVWSSAVFRWPVQRSLLQVEGLRSGAPFVIQSVGDVGYSPGAEPPWPGMIPAGANYGESDRWWNGAEPPNFGLWKVGQRIWRADARATLGGWSVTVAGWAAPRWKPGQPCAYGSYVEPIHADGSYYEATNPAAGRSGEAEPAWSSSGVVREGSCTWKRVGAAAVFKPLPANSSPPR